jgi:two-component system, OmpR family, KDP operon response regulator KdpE
MADRRVAGRVLLVEDDASFAGIVARHLRARGYEATVAPSKEAAVAVLDAGYRPSIVLLDINLPGESGWSLLRSGRLAAAGSPPVFIVSATVVPPARLREFGVAGYLPKPFALDTLLSTVERSTHPDGERGDI